MRALWEAYDGYTGTSYVRCYVWADTEEQAMQMAREAYETDYSRPNLERIARIRVKRLFTADAAPFCTKVSDDGWDL